MALSTTSNSSSLTVSGSENAMASQSRQSTRASPFSSGVNGSSSELSSSLSLTPPTPSTKPKVVSPGRLTMSSLKSENSQPSGSEGRGSWGAILGG
eukprot:CAMPEP_0184294472 /NCGR_PEP_ID=MMETSP1049-20130417/5642_1 /TAXON_ID=77928 /ORGANISM="Proteomonas sulcata, Strain CCMP704" /LENGTH=95 /DNA_ID=CAMNT_0026602769 /DNA_START=121 /DNA_END=408 /DNA_ORIENTATION=-